MLIIRTPFRISFFGGGTDFPGYFTTHGGCVLSVTINKYCYLTLRRLPPFLGFKNQLSYSKIERFDDPSEVQHPLVRAALQFLPVDRIQIAYDADLPACSGIGSSSAFAVGLLQGLHAMRGEYPDKMTLAKEAIHLERDLCQEAGGVQDQLASAFGGFNRMNFTDQGYEILPLDISEERRSALQNNLLLMFTGFTRFSGVVAKAQQTNIPNTIAQLDEMKTIVDCAQEILCTGELDDFGHLLHRTWKLKRTLSNQISTYQIDEIYQRAVSNGALGGKILGAGGGGFMLLYVPKERQRSFKAQMHEFSFVPFSFEQQGTHILYEKKDASEQEGNEER